MLNQIRKTIKRHSLMAPGDHVVVAVSGGPDSIALLRVLALLTDEFQLHLTTAHLNHGLRREEADRDEEFVGRLSAKMGITCICKKVDIYALQQRKGRSLEEVGREERYRFLDVTAEQCGAAKIAIGHHRDDQAETVLHHLLRGSGTTGLRGILPMRDGRIIRPLLDVGRDRILEFLRREGLSYMTDSTNENSFFLRNRIRNSLIPELVKHYNPQLIGALCKTAEVIRREDDYMQGFVQEILNRWGIAPGCVEILLPLSDFVALHEAIQARVIKCLLESMAPWRNGINYRHIEAILTLARRDESRCLSLDLPFRILIERERGMIRINKAANRRTRKKHHDRKPPNQYEYPVEVPKTIYLHEIDRTVRLEWIDKPTMGKMKNQPEIAFMDYNCINLPLVLRNRRPGDRVELLGMGGKKKKLKDYFIDRKVDVRRRGEIPLLADAASIVWIAGERISERVRVTQQTQKVLKVQIIVSKKPSEMTIS